jgi:hypothetical protein
MSHLRTMLLLAAAAGVMAAATPAFAQDASQGYLYDASGALVTGPTKYKHTQPSYTAYVPVQDSGCRLETYVTADHYTEYVTMCGPR